MHDATASLASAASPSQGSYDYIISGLTVRSGVELPSAIRVEMPHAAPDVTVQVGDVPEMLPAPERFGKDWAVQGDTFLMDLTGILRTVIRGGSSIVLQPVEQSDPVEVAVFLLGTCFAVLLQQRGRVVLHASAVAVGQRAMIFCGQSGAGKSTIAALLGQRGYPLLNDDVCNLHQPPGDDGYAVYPDGRMLKLWAASIEHLAWDGGRRIRRDMEKFYMAPQQFESMPQQVGGVYILHAQEGDGPASLERLGTAEAMMELLNNAYRPALVKAMEMTPSYFAASVGIQRRAGVYRLARPMNFARAEEALDVLEQHWAQLPELP